MKKMLGLLSLISMLMVGITGCNTDEIKNQVGSAIEQKVEEGKEQLKDKVNSMVDDTVDGMKDTISNAANGLIADVTGALQSVDTKDLKAANYKRSPYVKVNNNKPYFSDEDKNRTDAFEIYSELDSLGRCGAAYANKCKELMPTAERESISSVKPTGWNNREYDFVDGKWVYNRSHIIGFQLAGENANERNLITGTRYMNTEGMLPFENMIDDYVDETGNHVLYRVTPIFDGNNLLCEGVLMEAWSVEDDGDGICFNVFCYNVQPGIKIDYSNGNNWLAE